MSELKSELNEILAVLKRIAAALEKKNATTWQRTPDGKPICPKHGEVMVKREKQGDTWWSHTVVNQATGEKSYCRGYATKNGPGWWFNEVDQHNGADHGRFSNRRQPKQNSAHTQQPSAPRRPKPAAARPKQQKRFENDGLFDLEY